VLDIRLVREDPGRIRSDLAKRNAPDKAKLLESVIELDKEWRKALAEADALKRRRNEITREIAEAKKAGKSTEKLRKEAAGLPKKIDVLDKRIDELAAKVREGLGRLAKRSFHDPAVVCTAHSLPKKIMDDGDPYERELSETMGLVLRQLPPLRVRIAWQSAGRSEGAWLGPPLEEVLDEISRAGEKAVLVVPFGFVSDHLEILYDVDIEARAFATKRGLQFERTESPNTDPGFIDAMAAAVRSVSGPPLA